MSTKTLRKRIALVAVSAMGFGLLSIVPANAAALTSTNVTAADAAGAQTVGTAGTIGTATCSTPGAGAADDTVAIVVNGPAGAVVTVTELCADVLAHGTTNVVTAASNGTVTGTISEESTMAVTANSNITASFSMPGTYTVGIGGDADLITVRVLPSTTQTATLTASTTVANQTVSGSNMVVTLTRNTGGALTDGTILARVDVTADTSVSVREVFGESYESADLTAANSSASRVFTWLGATIDTAGTYTMTYWLDSNANNSFDSGEVSTTHSFTIAAAAASTSLISAALSKSVVNNGDTFTVTASITDADGNATTGTLRAAETTSTGATVTLNSAAGHTNVSATNTSSGSLLARVGLTNTYTGTFAADAACSATDYCDTYITVYINSTIAADSGTAATVKLRVVNLGELTVVSGATTVGLTDVVGVGSYDTSGVRQSISVADLTTDLAIDVDKTVTSQTYTFSAGSGNEGEYLKVVVAPAGVTSGSVISSTTAYAVIGADLTAKYTVTATAPAAADSYTLTVTDGSGDNSVITVTFLTATPAWTTTPSSNIKAKYGDKLTVTGTLNDQFGRALASKAVYVVVAASGRNGARVTGTTNASGEFAFTWTDASTSTVVLTDSITFNYDYLASATATSNTTKSSTARTVTYSATGIAVGSVSVTAPTATNTRAIDMLFSTGVPRSSTLVSYTASVKDAAGLPVVAGAIVTFSGGTGDLFYGGTSAVTDEFGQASVVVYRKTVGSPAIKATSGGITSAASPAVKWVNDVEDGDGVTAAPNSSSAKRQARYVSLSADKTSAASTGVLRFTAKVTDRWGNPVSGVELTFSETGAGRFYNPPTSNVATTNAAGEASIDVNSVDGETGQASVTVLITDATALQIDDTAGYIKHITEAGGTFTGTTTAAAGVTAAVKTVTATADITTSAATVTNADVLKSIVALIASINKQIQALQALILKKK